MKAILLVVAVIFYCLPFFGQNNIATTKRVADEKSFFDANTPASEGNTAKDKKHGSKKTNVEIRLKYDQTLDKIPVEITLDSDSDCYTTKIREGVLNYHFKVRKGKYLLLLTFQENDTPSGKMTYGLETIVLENIVLDPNGRLYSTSKTLNDNEFQVYRRKTTVIDIVLSFKDIKGKRTPFSDPIRGDFFCKKHLFKKREKTHYYNMFFRRSPNVVYIDKKLLKEIENFRLKPKKSKEKK